MKELLSNLSSKDYWQLNSRDWERRVSTYAALSGEDIQDTKAFALDMHQKTIEVLTSLLTFQPYLLDGKDPLDDSHLPPCNPSVPSVPEINRKILEKICEGHPVIASLAINGALIGSTIQESMRYAGGRDSVHAMLIIGFEQINGKFYWKFRDSNKEFAWIPMNEACRFLSLNTIELK